MDVFGKASFPTLSQRYIILEHISGNGLLLKTNKPNKKTLDAYAKHVRCKVS